MSLPPEKLTKWVARLMADITEEGAISRFELFHTASGEGAERIAVVRMKGGGEDEAGDVVSTLFSEAEHDAESRDTKNQRYTICAFRSDSQSDAEAQYAFRIEKANRFTGDDTEAPNEKGERAQAMRHLNETHNIMMRFAESLGGRLAGELDRETRRRHDAEEENRRMRVDFEDLQDRKLEREILRASLLQREKFMGDIVSSLLPLTPLLVGGLVNHFLGGKGDKNGKHNELAKALTTTSGGVEERENLLKQFFSGLSSGEGDAFQEKLKPMNRIVLGQIFQTLMTADESMKPAIDVSIQKFLKALVAEEVMGIVSVLQPSSRELFLKIYGSYAEIETKQQESLPEVLRDVQAPPAD